MKFLQPSLLLLHCFGLVEASPFSRLRLGQQAKRDNGSSTVGMYQLSSDEDFHFEILRAMSLAPYQGSDIGEVLVAAAQIAPGDFDSFYAAFQGLADRVHAQSQAIDGTAHPVSLRNSLFREATYLRSADFYLHGNWSDPRIDSLWAQQLAAFDAANALLPVPGERVVLPTAHGFDVPAIFFRAPQTADSGPRPTLLLCTGMDGSQEEIYHMVGEAALQRGIHVLTFEGPGQPTVRREQGLGFIPQWERVVSPVIDYALTRPEVDPNKIGLWGSSFGGELAPRAAAFDHRIAAVMAVDGIYDFGQGVLDLFGPDFTKLFEAGNATAFNAAIDAYLAGPDAVTAARWVFQQGLWAFRVATPYEWVQALQAYTLDGLVQDIVAPVFVAQAQDDMFFPTQPRELADKLGDKATFHLFQTIDGVGEHCSLGGAVLSNQVVLDWFEDTVGGR
ncbi:2,6-dihydropseudooxynicotine hydrolase [Xylariomycetidae sp. FL0641]|nr:2,6-dihydropseudooxynicotine hydrolase [Xylariomycetidae sp. FL0641]